MHFAKQLFYLTCYLILMIPSPTNAQELIGRVNEWPPYYFMFKGEWIGTNVDVYRALASEAGISLNLKSLPWSRAMSYMKTQPIIIGQLAQTDERKEAMVFVGPHAVEQMGLAIDREFADRKIDSIDDLVKLVRETDRRIAYQKNVFYSKEFNNRIESDPDFKNCFEEKATVDTVFKMIITKRLLGFFDDKMTLNYKILYEGKSDDIIIHPSFILNSTDVYVGISKTVPADIIQRLREANDRLLATGKYKQIYEKWDWYLKELISGKTINSSH